MSETPESTPRSDSMSSASEYAQLNSNPNTTPSLDASNQVTWVKPEDLYLDPSVLDRPVYEQILGRVELVPSFTKSEMRSDHLDITGLMYDYDLETDHAVMNEWNNPKVDLQSEINNRTKPFMEFGGPTHGGYPVIEGLDLPQKVLVSNITAGLPITRDEHMTLVGHTDLVADVQQMPLADESLGAVFAASLNAEIRSGAITESMRVLEPGGILIWQNATKQDVSLATESGFEVVRAVSTLMVRSRPQFSLIARKPVAEK